MLIVGLGRVAEHRISEAGGSAQQILHGHRALRLGALGASPKENGRGARRSISHLII
jgi:hypothetical protein